MRRGLDPASTVVPSVAGLAVTYMLRRKRRGACVVLDPRQPRTPRHASRLSWGPARVMSLLSNWNWCCSREGRAGIWRAFQKVYRMLLDMVDEDFVPKGIRPYHSPKSNVSSQKPSKSSQTATLLPCCQSSETCRTI